MSAITKSCKNGRVFIYDDRRGFGDLRHLNSVEGRRGVRLLFKDFILIHYSQSTRGLDRQFRVELDLTKWRNLTKGSVQTAPLNTPPTPPLIPQEIEIGWGYSVTGLASLNVLSIFAILTSGLTKVYTNRQKKGHCGVLHPGFPSEFLIPCRKRDLTCMLGISSTNPWTITIKLFRKM